MDKTATTLLPEEKLLWAIFGEDRGSYPPRSEVDGVTLSHTVLCVLAELTERERRVLHRRFGFGHPEGKGQTLAHIGLEFGVQRERIRQIEGKALRKLRWPGRSRRLKPYLVELEK